MPTDDQIHEYMNSFYYEFFITQMEDTLLSVMKDRQEKYPSEKNDKNWLDFTDFVLKRRGDNESTTQEDFKNI